MRSCVRTVSAAAYLMIMNDTVVNEELCADSFSSSHWVPPSVRSKIEVYRNQPRSIVDYEPGFSSIAIREAKTVSAPPPPFPSFPLPFPPLSVPGPVFSNLETCLG